MNTNQQNNTDEVLFEIKTSNLETGLRGVPVGYCTTSYVDPMKGIYYKGYSMQELVDKSPEEVIHLLLKGNLPSQTELREFNETLASYSSLDTKILETFRTFPKGTHPTKLFISGLNLLGAHYGNGTSLQESGYHVIAKLPELTAWVYRTLNDWGEEMKPSRPELGYIENFIHMLSPPDCDLEKLTTFMKYFLILHFDHGGGNLSTFVGKVVASAGSDLFESLIGAMVGLAGPLHGKANQESLRFLKDAQREITNPQDEEEVRAFIHNCIDNKRTIFGFGHAVLRVEDPRATIQYGIGEKLCPDDPIFALAKTFRKVGPEVLGGIKKISNPFPNVDAVSGCLLSALGLKNEDFYTVLFGMSRCVGIIAQIFYERLEAREGRGTPIVRPKYLYSGPVRDT